MGKPRRRTLTSRIAKGLAFESTLDAAKIMVNVYSCVMLTVPYEKTNKKQIPGDVLVEIAGCGRVADYVSLHRTASSCDWLVALSVVGRGLARGRNIFGAGLLQQIFCPARPFAVVAVNGQKNSSFLNAAFIAFGLIFRNAHPNQRTDNTANHSTGPDTCQGRHNRTSGNEGP